MKLLRSFETGILILILLVNIVLLVYFINPKLTANIVLTEHSDIKAPYDFIKENMISTENGKLVLNVTNFVLSRYNSTNSMIPTLNENSTGVGIKPFSEKDIHIGDIISFWNNNELIVHRVIDKKYDDKGVYFITKGDNSKIADKNKVRFEQVDSVLIAIFY